jgi:two-component system LytT family response regulator
MHAPQLHVLTPGANALAHDQPPPFAPLGRGDDTFPPRHEAPDAQSGRPPGATRLRVLIVDDELLARRRLRRYLAEEPGIADTVECASASAARAVLDQQRPHLVIMDADLPGRRELSDLWGALPAALMLVLLVPEFRHASAGGADGAVDYLQTPVTRPRFRSLLARVRRRVASMSSKAAETEVPAGLRRALGRVVVRSEGRILAIPSASLEWIETADNYIRLHRGDRVDVVRETLAAFEVRLDHERFVRIHRSAIVNIDAVNEIRCRRGRWEVHLRTGERLPVGRTYRRRVRAIMKT